MTLYDVFLVIVRWLHLLAAATWVGGSIFYLLVLRPTMRRTPDSPRALSAALGVEFRTIVVTCIVVLVVSGGIMAFDRLTTADLAYGAVLGVKVVLALWMFMLVRDRNRHYRALDAFREKPKPRNGLFGKVIDGVSGYNTLVILGVIVFLLSDLLKVLYEVSQ